MRKIRLRPEAEKNLNTIFEWYEAQRNGLGEDFLLCVEAVFEIIRENPTAYPCIHQNIRRALTRRFPYAVFYIVEDHTITVLNIFHGRRNPRLWKSRRSGRN